MSKVHDSISSGNPEETTWVEASEYFELALSSRKLWRCDQPGDGVLGLIDPETGQRYCVRRDSLAVGTVEAE